MKNSWLAEIGENKKEYRLQARRIVYRANNEKIQYDERNKALILM